MEAIEGSTANGAALDLGRSFEQRLHNLLRKIGPEEPRRPTV